MKNLKSQKTITRYKVLVVPFVVSSFGTCSFVMVRDRKTNEWGFISGGVKQGETYIDAARRELAEESSNLLFMHTIRPSFFFNTTYRPPELKRMDERRHETVQSVYAVFAYPLLQQDAQHWRSYFRSCFAKNEEVVEMDIRPFRAFTNLWSFCHDVYVQYLHILESV